MSADPNHCRDLDNKDDLTCTSAQSSLSPRLRGSLELETCPRARGTKGPETPASTAPEGCVDLL